MNDVKLTCSGSVVVLMVASQAHVTQLFGVGLDPLGLSLLPLLPGGGQLTGEVGPVPT